MPAKTQNPTHLRLQAGEAAKAARLIAEKAKHAGREMTADERAAYGEKADEALRLNDAAETAERDRKVLKQMDDVANGVGAPAGKSGGSWSATMLKNLDGFDGRKDLTPSGSITVPTPSNEIVLEPERPRRILQAVPRGPALAGTDSFTYLRETNREQNAAPVAPGAKKPTSVYQLEKVEDRARTIAHVTEPIERQTLADTALLEDYVDNSLRAGVELALEDEIVNGDGTGERFTGIANVSGTQAQAFDTDLIMTTRKAVTKLEEVAETVGGTWVLHPNDWESIELTQDNDGRYQFGGPVDRAARRLHGKPVITSTVVAEGTGYLVDFTRSTELRDREQMRVDWSENVYTADYDGEGSGATDFERNLIRFRGEGRWGFAIKRPRGIVVTTLTAA